MKTISLKKVSAVAVASLGFGLLSVVPAQAAIATAGSISGTSTTLYTTAGVSVTTPIIVTSTTTDGTAAQTLTITPTVTAPTGSLITVGAPGTNIVGIDTPVATTTTALTATAAKWTNATAAGVQTLTWSSGTVPAITSAETIGTLRFNSTVPGRYSVAVALTGTAGNTSATVVVYVSGAALTVAQSGLGLTTGTAVTGGQFTFSYTSPNATTVGTVHTIIATNAVINSATGKETDNSTNSLPVPLNSSAADWTSGAKWTQSTVTTSETSTYTLSVPTAGTATVTVRAIDATTGVPTVVATVSVTVTDTAASALASTQYSTVYMVAGATLATSTTDVATTPVTCSKTAGTQCANLAITVKNSLAQAYNLAPISVSVTGPAILGLDSDGTPSGNPTATGTALSDTAIDSGNLASVSIWPGGSSGTAVVTVKSGTVVLATKTLIFYGTVAKLEATQVYSIAKASAAGATLGTTLGTAGTTAATDVVADPAVTIKATDSDGNVVPLLTTITAVSSDPTVIVSSAISEDSAAVQALFSALNLTLGAGYYNASVTSAVGGTSGKTATVYWRIPNPLAPTTYIETAKLTFKLGGVVAKEVITTDKTSYAPGESMLVTITATDASGNSTFDNAASPAISGSKTLGGSMAAGVYVGGKKTSKANTLFAPSTSGTFTLLATGTDAAATKLSASASVTDANAGLLTQIDALNAKIVALNALIAKIMKKLGVK